MNNTVMHLYREKSLTLNIDLKHTFPWTFLHADIKLFILVVYFLCHYELIVDASKQYLVNSKASLCKKSLLHIFPKINTQDWRTCGNYQTLNRLIILYRYPILCLQDFTSSLLEKTLFSKMDLIWAYRQTPVAKKDIIKTAKAKHFVLFKFKKMPFVFKNIGQTFPCFIKLFHRLDFCIHIWMKPSMKFIFQKSYNICTIMNYLFLLLWRLTGWVLMFTYDKQRSMQKLGFYYEWLFFLY